jgi:hypothetical protein
MEQASNRKMSDPNYVNSENRTRGIIIHSPTTINADGTITVKQSNLDSQDLRSALLYWDKLSFPRNQVIYIGGGPEAKELVNCGIMERPTIDVIPSGDSDLIMTSAEAIALQQYDQKEPGVWSVGSGANSLSYSGSKSGTGTGLELYNSLPIPGENVPLVEILDFKERRRSELLMFRSHMDSMISAITSADDSGEALIKALKDLDEACANLISVTKEWKLPVRLANFKASINFNFAKSATAAAAAWKATDTLALGKTEQAVAATVAGISSNFKLSADIEFQKIKRPTSPYKYLYQATQELKA